MKKLKTEAECQISLEKNNRANGIRDAPINIEPWEWITLEWVESTWKFGEAMGCKRVALFIMKSKRKKKKEESP